MANFSNPESVTAAIAEVLNSTARSGWYYITSTPLPWPLHLLPSDL